MFKVDEERGRRESLFNGFAGNDGSTVNNGFYFQTLISHFLSMISEMINCSLKTLDDTHTLIAKKSQADESNSRPYAD